MFAAEFEPAQPVRRRSPRESVSLDATVGNDRLGRALCKVIDVSLYGTRLATYSALLRGSVIWLILPPIGHVTARVMWADDFTAGCRFDKALTQRQLDTLLGEQQGH